jgi:hypothetical protein
MQNCSWRHGGRGARRCAEGDGRSGSGNVVVLAVPWRRASTMASATGRVRASGVVQEGADGVVIERARGEGEGRTDATGRACALAHPVSCACALWHGLGMSGRVRARRVLSCAHLLFD